MKAYALPDGRLVVPRRAESDGVRGDGMAVVETGDPDYRLWMDYFERFGQPPVPIASWPVEDTE